MINVESRRRYVTSFLPLVTHWSLNTVCCSVFARSKNTQHSMFEAGHATRFRDEADAREMMLKRGMRRVIPIFKVFVVGVEGRGNMLMVGCRHWNSTVFYIFSEVRYSEAMVIKVKTRIACNVHFYDLCRYVALRPSEVRSTALHDNGEHQSSLMSRSRTRE